MSVEGIINLFKYIIMTRIQQRPITTLNAVTTTGVGVALNVANYRTLVLQLATTGSATATIKIAASMSLEQPDFASSASPTNQWSYIVVNDLSTASQIPGATGIVLTGTDVVNLYEVNTNYVRWLCPNVTAYAAGTITLLSDAVDEYSRG